MVRLGDRWSHRGVMSIGALGRRPVECHPGMDGCLSSLALCPSFSWNLCGHRDLTIPLAIECQFLHVIEDDRPLYIGMANTIPAPAAILAPILGGWLADTAGFHFMFLFSALFGF